MLAFNLDNSQQQEGVNSDVNSKRTSRFLKGKLSGVGSREACAALGCLEWVESPVFERFRI